MISVAQPLTEPLVPARPAVARRREPVATRAVAVASPVTRAGFIVWVPFWLSLGIGLWFLLRQEPGRMAYGLAAILFVAGGLGAVLPRLRFVAAAGRMVPDRIILWSFALMLVAGGFLITGWRSHSVAAPVLEYRYYGPIEGRVTVIDRSGRDRVRITLDRVVLRDMAPARTPAKVRLSLMGDQPVPAPGEHVMLTGHLGPPPGPSEPGGFDFRRMAWFERLGAVGYVRAPILRAGPAAEGGLMALHRTRMQLSQAIQDQIGGQAGAVAAALMTGDRSAISEATNDVMRISSLYHIISISGLHMTMLAAFVYGTLRFVGTLIIGLSALTLGTRMSPPLHKFAAMGALLASAGYLWLSGGGVATERAFIMVAVMLVAILADRRAISLRTVAIAAVLVLVLGPEALTSPGFQMSFAATVALVLMARPWNLVSPHLPKWSHAVILLLLTSVMASLATGPIAAAQFGRVAPYGIFANLLVVPVMGAAVMNMGVIALLLAPFGLEGWALWVMGLGTKWMLWTAEWIAGLNGADILLPLPPGQVVALIGTGMMLAAFARRRLITVGGLRLPAPVFSTGVLLLVASLIIWVQVDRPDILVSEQGDAVGLMTDAGRAMSKDSGGAFSVENWLADDGDAATQVESAARPAWAGPRNLREASVVAGQQRFRLIHATGKGAQDAAKAACSQGVIVIVDRPLASSGITSALSESCLILDGRRLAREGALAIDIGRNGLVITSAAMVTGTRAWSRRAHVPFAPLTGLPRKE